MNALHHSPSVPARRCRGFSLIEIMVAVALMAVITLGLLAMFYQTQRAIHMGSTQTDVLESGRATMQLLVGELAQATVADSVPTNLFAAAAFPLLSQPRPRGGDAQVNVLQDLYFLRQLNDEWVGTGYYVDAPIGGGAGALHRFEQRLPISANPLLICSNFLKISADPSLKTNLAPRLSDRVIHLQLRPYDAAGVLITAGDFTFSNRLPAYLEVELGILEARAYAKYLALTNDNDPVPALRYLSNQVERVHLFRQRIPIRTAQ